MTADTPLLEIRGLSKRFGMTDALRSVDLDLPRNRVVGIVGENGAGKSTLLNIMSGLMDPDDGEMRHSGVAYRPRTYADALGAGVSRVFQEQALIPNIKVYENLLLSHEGRFVRFAQVVRRRAMIDLAQSICDEAGIAVDVRRVTSSYSFSKRQLIEIVRACFVPLRVLGAAAPIVLLDEPTASLERGDEDVFFSLLAKMRQLGAVAFVSHRLNEVIANCDDIVVFKDGCRVASVDPGQATESSLHGLMVGRTRHADHYQEARRTLPEGQAVALQVDGLSRSGCYSDVSLTVRGGEILGLGGLLASGKSDLAKGLAGVVRPDSGTVRLAGGLAQRPDISRLVGQGVGYVPAERLAEGMIVDFPVAWNISVASGDRFSSALGLWRGRDETAVARTFIERLNIRTQGPEAICWTLSGGNQQKVVLARWLCRDLKVLILDNPTRGVDAGAKEEIYSLIRSLTADGVAIVLVSDELLELIGLSNRIALMQNGRIVAERQVDADAKPSERDLVELMLSTPASRQPEGRAA